MNYVEKITDKDIENLLQKNNLKPINIMRNITKDKEPFAIIYCEKIKKSTLELFLEDELSQFNNVFNINDNRYYFGKNVLFLTNFTLNDSFHDVDYSVELYNFIMNESSFDSETKQQYKKDFIAYYKDEIKSEIESENLK